MSSYQIKNSYKVLSRDEMKSLLLIYKDSNTHEVFLKRSMKSLINEWCVHNLLYNLHLFRSRTKDVDFEFPLKSIFKILYFILSIFYIH